MWEILIPYWPEDRFSGRNPIMFSTANSIFLALWVCRVILSEQYSDRHGGRAGFFGLQSGRMYTLSHWED